MDLNEYQERAMTTCMRSSHNFSYMFINLVGEVGELASKVAKAIRKERLEINENVLQAKFATFEETEELNKALMLEAGDVLWELAGLCSAMGWNLNEIAQMNLDKLSARKAIGTIDGNGDGIIR